VQGEYVLRIAGLAAPPGNASAAATLLAERVRGVDQAFRVDGRNADAVDALCRRLEGIPLALELAAARVRCSAWKGPVPAGRQLGLLSRGTRCSDASADAARRAAVEPRAARCLAEGRVPTARGVRRHLSRRIGRAVCTANPAKTDGRFDALHALVDKSLVTAVPEANGGGRRLRLLVTAREFAFERLVEASEREATQARHADAVAAIFERALDEVPDAPLLPWVDRLWPEVPCLRAALRWAASADGDPQRLVALVAAAGYFWNAAGLDREAQRWIDIARPLIDTRRGAARRSLLQTAAYRRSIEAPLRMRSRQHSAQLRSFRALGDAPGEYRMLGIQAHHARRVDPPSTSLRCSSGCALERRVGSRCGPYACGPRVLRWRSGRWQSIAITAADAIRPKRRTTNSGAGVASTRVARRSRVGAPARAAEG
jgi:hypothetical protein